MSSAKLWTSWLWGEVVLIGWNVQLRECWLAEMYSSVSADWLKCTAKRLWMTVELACVKSLICVFASNWCVFVISCYAVLNLTCVYMSFIWCMCVLNLVCVSCNWYVCKILLGVQEWELLCVWMFTVWMGWNLMYTTKYKDLIKLSCVILILNHSYESVGLV